MKKIIILIAVLFALVGCKQEPKTDTIYNLISLNSSKADMSEYVLLKDKDHAFEIISIQEANRVFFEKGTAILYFGYPQCPFCNRIVPALNDAAKSMGVKVYYIDIYAEGSTEEDINKLFENIESILEKDSTGQPLFYVPEVISVKNGFIADHHLSVVSSYNDVTKDLTDKQYDELKNIYINLIKKLQQ